MINDQWTPGRIVNDVLFGRHEHLFLAQGAHRVLDRVIGAVPVSQEAYATFSETVVKRKEFCDSMNLDYLHVILPDKQTVLADEFPFEGAVSMARLFEREVGSLNGSIFYSHNTLAEHAGVFKRADTHLTDKGTIITACQIVEKLTVQSAQPILTELLGSINDNKSWSGDLGGKLSPPIAFDEYFYRAEQKPIWFHNSLSGGNNGIVDLYFAKEPKFSKRVLLFGDSFGRDICRFLGILFREVVFLRTPFLHDEMVRMIMPDIVITENVERYLHQSRSDELRESFLMYPYFRDEIYNPGTKFARAFSALLSFPRTPYKQFISTM
jgi:hypothetical protein